MNGIESSVGILSCSTITMLGVIGLLFAEYVDKQSLRIVCKPIAVFGFLALAILQLPFSNMYAITVCIGLFLCALGDFLLLPQGAGKFFLGGVGAFLMGHVAYSVAFLTLPLHPITTVATLIPMLFLAHRIHRWLKPDIPNPLRIPVSLYIIVITVMVVLSVGVAVENGDLAVLPLSAGLFWLSDISVARDRFQKAGFSNKLWGVPFYFGAQLLFAFSIGLVST
ncbi:MAG: lysoplasmalogenase [Myxococcota bacterium]|nr:lysoplasmalogenase [Myxococcota bacterium]